jgi:hypothetical protein
MAGIPVLLAALLAVRPASSQAMEIIQAGISRNVGRRDGGRQVLAEQGRLSCQRRSAFPMVLKNNDGFPLTV